MRSSLRVLAPLLILLLLQVVCSTNPTSQPTGQPTSVPTKLGYLFNSGFESDAVSTWSYMTPTGWSGQGAGIIVMKSQYAWSSSASCASGSYCVGVQGIGNYLYQSLHVPSNYLATVTFYITSRSGFASTGCTVTYGSVTLGTYYTTDSWVLQTASIPATSGDRTDSLKFTQSAYSCSGDCTFLIDSVSVTVYGQPSYTPTHTPTYYPSSSPHSISIITTVAGTGTASYSGDNGPATAATIYGPHGIAIDSSGNVYFSDMSNHRMRKITVSTGVITTYAGTGASSFSGDGGVASSAALNLPHGLCLDTAGTRYVLNSSHNP